MLMLSPLYRHQNVVVVVSVVVYHTRTRCLPPNLSISLEIMARDVHVLAVCAVC